MRSCIALALLIALAGCAGPKSKPVVATRTPHANSGSAPTASRTRSGKRPAFVARGPYTAGGLYAPDIADSAPELSEDISALPEPVPKNEPRSRYGNRTPYVVLGETYNVLPTAKGYVERGIASWYGTKFDGRATSNFEAYDMYQFTGAHKTLPLPSYVRVTNLDNSRSVIVRINDRGPFYQGRLIDLSYAAAIKLGVNIHGTAPVEVRAIDPDDPGSDRPATGRPVIAAATTDRAVDADTGASRSRQPATPPPAAPTDAVIATTTPIAAVHALASTVSVADASTGFLRIASFGERGNAERLLARLRDAGIDGAALREVEIDGRALWRVTIGPLAAAAAPRVADRIEALGLGHPAFFSGAGHSD